MALSTLQQLRLACRKELMAQRKKWPHPISNADHQKLHPSGRRSNVEESNFTDTMKRALLLAAIATVTTGAAKANPIEMFNIQTPAAGSIVFSGSGTASFNNQIGTQNSFNVGSATNLGVNASASSTQDYDAMGSAQLDLAGTSTLQQTIGTSSNAANVATAQTFAATSAATTAREVANSSEYGASYNYGWGVEWAADNDVDTATAGWEVEAKGAWQAGWENKYNDSYTQAYSTALSTATTAASQTSNTGMISGSFETRDSGSNTAAISALSSSFESGAASSASAAVGASWNSNDGQYESQVEWQAAYDSAYQQAYSQAYSSAAAAAQRVSTSDVEVGGIGVIATINAADSSSFSADVIRASGTAISNGNGNASAGASLSTVSVANQSNNTNASAFMQAFTGGSGN
jgi:hypothetical protein